MLISTDKRFILLSPTKVASSGVGAILSRFCCIAIGDPAFGKHDLISQITERYEWIFRKIRLEEFKIILLFRNPIERAISLYASHSGSSFDGLQTSTAGLSAEEFVSNWVRENTWMSMPQFLHGLLENDGFHVDYIVRQDCIRDDMAGLNRFLDIDLDLSELKYQNVSPKICNVLPLRDEIIKSLSDFYSIDQMIFDNYSGRLLSDVDKMQITSRICFDYGSRNADIVAIRLKERHLDTMIAKPKPS